MELEFSQEGVASWFERSHRAKPFLKWAGGKQRWVAQYGHLLPEFRGAYIEPFLGGGSVYFYLARSQRRPFPARLGDVNRHLIRTYVEVRDDPESVTRKLDVLQAGYRAATDKSGFYYDLRDSFNSKGPQADAGTFIFLMRLCWNGLYRVNKDGIFNVPFGAPKSDQIAPTRDEILNASAALMNVHLRATSWEHLVALAEPGDFIFLDPPYFSDTFQRSDSKYRKTPFGLHEHQRLADYMEDIASRGVDFLLTNSAEPEMVKLYAQRGFDVLLVEQPRSINSNTSERGGVDELVVTPGGSVDTQKGASASVLLELEAQRIRATQLTIDGDKRNVR